MPFSHHSHSGQFCSHASDRLEDIVEEAIKQKMQTFALTEHMPRNLEEDLYPGESEIGYDVRGQAKAFDEFYATARRLQTKYADRIALLVGMESDWIRASSQACVEDLLRRYPLDLFVGSAHHVHGIPIDYSSEMYAKALAVTTSDEAQSRSAAEKKLFMDYFDAQLDMLTALRPPVVGHFDLIRLFSETPDQSLDSTPEIWEKVVRNLKATADYGGALELNSAALRKGLREPYPKQEVCKKFRELGGKFVFSDDSHSIQHVGQNFVGLLEHAQAAGIRQISMYQRNLPARDARFPNVGRRDVDLEELRTSDFWGSKRP